MEKILIIGSEGQLGTELASALRKHYKEENIITADLIKESKENSIYEQLDVTDYHQLTKIINKHKVSQIYLLAAILSAKGELNPELTWKVNMDGLMNVLKIAQEHKLKKIFWPSSIAVFGPDTPREKAPQNSIMNPQTIYGISKLAGEKLCDYYFRKHKVDVRSIRYPGLIGYKALPGGGTTDYAVDIFHKAVNSQRFNCFLEPDTYLPMMYMPDAIDATIRLMEAPTSAITVHSSYNVSGFSISPAGLTRAIRQIIPGFEIEYKPDNRQEIAATWPKDVDDSMAQEDWGWKPSFTLGKMVEDMIKNLSLKLQV